MIEEDCQECRRRILGTPELIGERILCGVCAVRARQKQPRPSLSVIDAAARAIRVAWKPGKKCARCRQKFEGKGEMLGANLVCTACAATIEKMRSQVPEPNAPQMHYGIRPEPEHNQTLKILSTLCFVGAGICVLGSCIVLPAALLIFPFLICGIGFGFWASYRRAHL